MTPAFHQPNASMGEFNLEVGEESLNLSAFPGLVEVCKLVFGAQGGCSGPKYIDFGGGVLEGLCS